MIQRLQTLLLLAAAIVNFTLIFLPVWYTYNENGDTGQSMTAELYGNHIVVSSDDGMGEWNDTEIAFSENAVLFVGFALVVLNSLFLLVLIFLYKDRPRQLKLTYSGIFALLVQIVVFALLIMQLDGLVGEPHSTGPLDRFESGFKFGLLAPVVAVLFTWWASFRIRRDEKKVKDMDRLR